MLKCKKCGCLFEEGEEKVIIEKHGLDCPPYEEIRVCPECGGDYEEAVECEICGEHYLEDELHGGVCDCCIKEKTNDADFCYKISKREKEPVKLNCFLTCMFTPAEIEEVLLKQLKEEEKHSPIDCSKFINFNKDWFGEQMCKEEN